MTDKPTVVITDDPDTVVYNPHDGGSLILPRQGRDESDSVALAVAAVTTEHQDVDPDRVDPWENDGTSGRTVPVPVEAVNRVVAMDAIQRGGYGTAVRDVLVHLGLLSREQAQEMATTFSPPEDPVCGRTYLHLPHETTAGDCSGLTQEDAEQVRRARADANIAATRGGDTVTGHLDPQIAGLEAARAALSAATRADGHFIAPDGDGVLTIWSERPEDLTPEGNAIALITEEHPGWDLAARSIPTRDLEPLRMPEPGTWGVVTSGCDHSTQRLDRVRYPNGRWYCPSDSDLTGDAWDDLIDPVLVRDGAGDL